MSSDDYFENRLRAMAEQISQSLAQANVDEVAQRLNLDPDRVRGVRSVAQRWIDDRLSEQRSPFGDPAGDHQHDSSSGDRTFAAAASGSVPHPLDLPTRQQGAALAGLDSGRLTMRPGSGRLVPADCALDIAAGDGGDIGNELRVRDWVTADGSVTLVGHQALLRWCAGAADPKSSEAR